MRFRLRPLMRYGALATVASLVAAVVLPLESIAVMVPSEEEEAVLANAEDRGERVLRMHRLGAFRLGAGLQQQSTFKIRESGLEALGYSPGERAVILNGGPEPAFPFTARPELRSIGTVRTVTVLVDFSDIQANSELPDLTAEDIAENIYGSGTSAAQAPYESVRAYYQRASEGKLTIDGDVLDWVHLAKKRSDYEPVYAPNASAAERAAEDNRALFALISEALDRIDATTDFAQYDNDHDGDIDLVTIMYAGPNEGWGSFWWAYRWDFYTPEAYTKKFDGKRLKQFVFQFVDVTDAGDFDPHTLIHETGHALGLPDLYDYCSTTRFNLGSCPASVHAPGPDGGVGGLDMMDANLGNHNALSRWLLDWITPTVVVSEKQRFRLIGSGDTTPGTEALAIFPSLQPTDAPSQELFLVEYRPQVGNDGGIAQMPGEGLLIWHVDASANPSDDDFRYDNSYSDRKLIRLVRSGSAVDFRDREWASAQDYFLPGASFGPSTAPDSSDYSGTPTNVAIGEIALNGDEMHLEAGVGETKLGADQPDISADPSVVALKELSEALAYSMQLSSIATLDQGRLTEFDRQVQFARPEDLANLWEKHKAQIDYKATPSEHTILAEMLVTQWATKDGLAAVSALLEAPESEFIRRVFPRAMEAWANNDPKGANDWYFDQEQQELRADEGLQAGERFTEALFHWRALSTPDTAAIPVDLLSAAPEVYGAVKGLRQSAEITGTTEAELDGQLKALSVNGQEALALMNLQRAVENAAEYLGTEMELIDSGALMRERMQPFGIEVR